MSEMKAKLRPFKSYPARHFQWTTDDSGRVATITLNRPDKKNPLTFDSYEELRGLFRTHDRRCGEGDAQMPADYRRCD